ncbi:MAG: PUA domain-containing protein [Candidatus Aenigmatarchaeota archaeon]
MNLEELLDIVEFQFGKEIRKRIENLDLKIKKFKSRKIEIYLNNNLLLSLNPKFFLFSINIEFAKILVETKKFYIKVKNEFINDIKKTKNIIRKNILEYSKDFRSGDDIIVIDENNNLIGIAKAKFNYNEIENSTYGLIAKIKKFYL